MRFTHYHYIGHPSLQANIKVLFAVPLLAQNLNMNLLIPCQGQKVGFAGQQPQVKEHVYTQAQLYAQVT